MSNSDNSKCPHWKDGWCYAQDCEHNACVNTWACDYFMKVVRKVIWGDQKKERDDE